MKKVIICLVAMLVVFSFVGLTSVYAYPFIEVEGFVDPTQATVVNNGTTSTFSQVFYHFNVMTADAPALMDFLSLEFEAAVFAGHGSLSFDSPTDWGSSAMTSSSGNVYEILNAGTGLGVGDKLRFTVQDVIVYNTALIPGNTLWQEGQIWAQSWLAGDTLRGGDGGSTALVPEPGTLMLFGAGIAGLFYVRRARVFNI